MTSINTYSINTYSTHVTKNVQNNIDDVMISVFPVDCGFDFRLGEAKDCRIGRDQDNESEWSEHFIQD